MEYLSVAEAAAQLGMDVSRVRSLAAQGKLPAERIGNRWAINASAVNRREAGSAGRPMAPRVAWACIALLNGDRPDWLSPQHAYGLRRRMRDRLRGSQDRAGDVRVLRAWMADHATVFPLRGSRGVERQLADDPRLVLTGATALGGLSSAGLTAYVSEPEAIMRDYLLLPAHPAESREPQVALFVSSFAGYDITAHGPDARTVGPVLAAVDQLDQPDARTAAVVGDTIAAAVDRLQSGSR